MTIRTATYMRLCGFTGLASFWRVIYVLHGDEHDERLLRHQRYHLEQIERDGQRGQRDGPIAHEIVI